MSLGAKFYHAYPIVAIGGKGRSSRLEEKAVRATRRDMVDALSLPVDLRKNLRHRIDARLIFRKQFMRGIKRAYQGPSIKSTTNVPECCGPAANAEACSCASADS